MWYSAKLDGMFRFQLRRFSQWWADSEDSADSAHASGSKSICLPPAQLGAPDICPDTILLLTLQKKSSVLNVLKSADNVSQKTRTADSEKWKQKHDLHSIAIDNQGIKYHKASRHLSQSKHYLIRVSPLFLLVLPRKFIFKKKTKLTGCQRSSRIDMSKSCSASHWGIFAICSDRPTFKFKLHKTLSDPWQSKLKLKSQRCAALAIEFWKYN